MDPETRKEIERILANVESINDLTVDIVAQLKSTNVGRFPIQKFKVKPGKFKLWFTDMHPRHGVEYDAKERHVIIKARHSNLHKLVSSLGGLTTLRKCLNLKRKNTGLNLWSLGTTVGSIV